jgi:hypothetical protein
MPPPLSAVLPLTVLSVMTSTASLDWLKMPPPEVALLSLIVTLVSVSGPPGFAMPPPSLRLSTAASPFS